MYKEFISLIEKIDNLYLVIIGLIGWAFFLVTYIFRRRHMQNILNRLEEELKKNNEIIRDLENQLHTEKKSKIELEKDINSLKIHHPGLTSAIEVSGKGINEKPPIHKVDSFVKEWLFMDYGSHYFEKEKGIKKGAFSREVVYRINLKTENQGTFELVNEDNDDYILNKDLYLLSGLCRLKYSDNSTRKKIGSIIPGKVHLENDKWIVDEKVQIEIL